MRLLLAIWLGKLIFFLTRTLKTGGGSAAPGYYALKIYPELVKRLAKQIPQNIVITGTNGKTTTARLLSHFIQAQNIKVIKNSTGSNLARGITSSLIAHSDFFGRINVDLGIWELDEASFNTVVLDLKPEIMVFLNAFRDQLDRYGEVDSVVKKWQHTLEKIDWEAAIVVNGGDNHTWSLTKQSTDYRLPSTASFYEFRVQDHKMAQEKKQAGNQKHQDDFVAQITKNKGLSGIEFNLKFPDEKLKIDLPIPGIYHVYDFLAAFSAYYLLSKTKGKVLQASSKTASEAGPYLLNLPLKEVNYHLQSYLPAFGRVEKIKLEKSEAYIFLIKNPVGATEVFQTIAPELQNGDRLLIALNDNFADGKDVSWIWDASFEQLISRSANQPKSVNQLTSKSVITGELDNRSTGPPVHRLADLLIYCSGSRAQDLALRLKYAGIDQLYLKVENELNKALSKAQDGLQGRLFILPTYTTLLELQQLLAKQGLKKHYWKES